MQQVRIEQQITIRVGRLAPASPLMPTALAEIDDNSGPISSPRVLERKFGRCVAANAVAGAQPGPGNHLMLFLRDSRVLNAALEKSCQGRDYYLGFMVQHTADGMICAGRDRLLSRSGANCQLRGFKQLVDTGN